MKFEFDLYCKTFVIGSIPDRRLFQNQLHTDCEQFTQGALRSSFVVAPKHCVRVMPVNRLPHFPERSTSRPFVTGTKRAVSVNRLSLTDVASSRFDAPLSHDFSLIKPRLLTVVKM